MFRFLILTLTFTASLSVWRPRSNCSILVEMLESFNFISHLKMLVIFWITQRPFFYFSFALLRFAWIKHQQVFNFRVCGFRALFLFFLLQQCLFVSFFWLSATQCAQVFFSVLLTLSSHHIPFRDHIACRMWRIQHSSSHQLSISLSLSLVFLLTCLIIAVWLNLCVCVCYCFSFAMSSPSGDVRWNQMLFKNLVCWGEDVHA